MRRLLLRLRNERGIALAMALGMMVVLAMASTTAIYYTSAGQRSSGYSKGKQLALSLAEAGLNNTMAVLNEPINNSLKQSIMPKCTSNAEANWNLSTYDGGSVRWCGDLDLSTNSWSVTAIGIVRNPTGATVSAIRHKITSYVVVTPTVTQPLNNPAWDYMFSTRTGNACDQNVNNNVGGGSRFYVNGNLCIGNNANLSPSNLIVKGNVDLSNNTSVGASTSMATRAETYIGGQCKYGNSGTWTTTGCAGDQDARYIYSKRNGPSYVVGVNGTPPVMSAPNADFAGWYENAIPGPKVACTASSGTPPTFDVLTAGSPPVYVRDNNVSIQDLTPNASYTCRVGPVGNPDGELSWDYATKTLTVRGTLFIDGSAKIDNGALNQYNGQASLYLSGTFYLNGKLCGGVSGADCDFNAWNPNTEMLTVVTGSTGGQNPVGDGVYLTNGSSFQGAFFSGGAIELGNNAKSDGPMVGTQIILSNNVTTSSFPNIVTVPAGMPGNPAVYAQPNPPQRFSG